MFSLAFVLSLAQATPAQASPSPAPSPLASPSVLIAQPALANLHPAGLRQPPVVVAISNATGALSATLDAAVATANVDQTNHTITLQGTQQTGRATLHVSDAAGAAIDLPVRNAYDAGTIASSVTLKVTGDPLDPAWLQTQIAQALGRATLVQPGLTAQFAGYALPPSLPPGSVAAIAVPVQIPGGDAYYDASGTTNVSVENIVASGFAPPVLFYDDDPEKVDAAGVLYRGRIAPGTPTRLYYYHENGGDPHDLLLVLSGVSQDPTSVQVIDSTAGPNIDVLSVGHAVTKNFLLTKPQNEGTIVDLPQTEPYLVHDLKMQRLDGVAGNVDLRVMSGGAVTVTVLAVPPLPAGFTPPVSQIAPYLDQPQLPGDGHHRTGVFALAGYGVDQLTYRAGGQDVFARYGATTPPSADPNAPGHDYGDYGVLHRIDLTLDNPTAAPVSLYLYETPQGGVLRSSFLVDGTLHEVGCTRVPNRYLIAALPPLGPGEHRASTVLTMTDGGSSYPVEVGVTATPPATTAPPIGAPDGCFPKPVAAPVF
ncbi:MAG TPA: hypothetical protein VIG32_09200 [Candidatus Baltobacteraceae bacterium]|jgi:hypothetical protein